MLMASLLKNEEKALLVHKSISYALKHAMTIRKENHALSSYSQVSVATRQFYLSYCDCFGIDAPSSPSETQIRESSNVMRSGAEVGE